MPQKRLFIFTAGNPEARSHLDVSIRNPMDQARVLKHFSDDDQKQIRTFAQPHGLFAWGAIPGVQNTPRWELMQPGDWVLCVFDSRYRYVAQVVAKYNNESFANDTWGRDPDGKTWSLMYFLTRPIETNVSVEALSSHLNASYMGFFRISDEKVDQIEQKYGSLDSFIEKELLSGGSFVEIPDGITREDVIQAIKDYEAGVIHDFGDSTKYDLIHEAKRYPPKAIIGLAARRVLGRALRPSEFSGGENSKAFRVLRDLGFYIEPKFDDSAYFVIRLNEQSQYADELGSHYAFTSQVPNQKKLRLGGRVVIDRKTPEGLAVLGYGILAAAAEQGPATQDGPSTFRARFDEWHPFSFARPLSAALLEKVSSMPGYNVQHAIRPITKEIFDELRALGEATECWIFQANPQMFDIRSATRQLKRIRWLSKQHVAEFKADQPVYLWESGPTGGIVAVAKILEPTQELDDDEASAPFRRVEDKFTGVQPRVVLEVLRIVDPPLTRDAIRNTNALRNLSILKAPQGTNFPVTQDEARVLRQMLEQEMPMDFDALQKMTLLDKDFLRELVDALVGPSKQIILAGPPGTGKTRIARALATYLTDSMNDRIRFVQFHASYSYESFIEGLRPVAKQGGGISFEQESGVVLELVRTMQDRRHVGRDAPLYVIVIDEMNRANLPRVLGELMFLMEYRDQVIRLQYSKEFSLPENLRIIGTMNTADRSIRSIDIALRRRFDVFEIEPSAQILRQYFEGKDLQVSNLESGLTALNAVLRENLDRHHTIGHAYFMQPSLDRVSLRRIWDRKLYPLIEEYFFDQTDIAEEFKFERFWPEAAS